MKGKIVSRLKLFLLAVLAVVVTLGGVVTSYTLTHEHHTVTHTRTVVIHWPKEMGGKTSTQTTVMVSH